MGRGRRPAMHEAHALIVEVHRLIEAPDKFVDAMVAIRQLRDQAAAQVMRQQLEEAGRLARKSIDAHKHFKLN